MSASAKEIDRAVELLIKMTPEQRRKTFERVGVCSHCMEDSCGGWCDYQTPTD